jgi:hypothetical protein
VIHTFLLIELSFLFAFSPFSPSRRTHLSQLQCAADHTQWRACGWKSGMIMIRKKIVQKVKLYPK